MNQDEVNRELRRAWKWLLRFTRGDEEKATDALPLVWLAITRDGQQVCTRTIKQALWRVTYHDTLGVRPRGKRRDDALPGASKLTSYCASQRRFINPSRACEIHEAVFLVKRAAQLPMERRILKGLLLGVNRERKSAYLPDNTSATRSSFKRFRERCRKAFPSLIGIA